jgi:hypothetical protein
MGGNLCGVSTGEALSRWCAETTTSGSNPLAAFATAPHWAADGMKDWVTVTDQTDRNPDSIGCGMAFISWLISMGHGLSTVAPQMVALGESGTLAKLYAGLSGKPAAEAWPNFQTAIKTIGGAAAIKTDNPFAQKPEPMTAIVLAKKLIQTIVVDVADGKSARQLAADVSVIIGV